MNPNIDDLFTVASLLTLQGASVLCFIVPNVVGYLIPSVPDQARKWIAFLVAMAVALAVATTVDEGGAMKWFVAVCNGFLIAASAFGFNEITRPSTLRTRARSDRRFLTPWRTTGDPAPLPGAHS